MGTYVYNLRKKQATMLTAEGSVSVNHYRYAYKEWLGNAWDSAVERRRDFIRDNAERVAERAWHETEHRFAVICDEKVEDGDVVYTAVERPLWYDTNPCPMLAIGWARRVGRAWHVVDRSRWELIRYLSSDGSPAERHWKRDGVINGIGYVQHATWKPEHGETARWDLPGQASPDLAKTEVEIEIVY
jgi:hypothetical protein